MMWNRENQIYSFQKITKKKHFIQSLWVLKLSGMKTGKRLFIHPWQGQNLLPQSLPDYGNIAPTCQLCKFVCPDVILHGVFNVTSLQVMQRSVIFLFGGAEISCFVHEYICSGTSLDAATMYHSIRYDTNDFLNHSWRIYRGVLI